MSEQPHIFIVDDERDIRELVGKYLKNHGMRTSLANGGSELRRLLKQSVPDLIVLDIMMPGEDGLELCRFIRSTSSIPVILLTAMAEETDRIIGLEIGADDYLTKPFNPRELLARIKAVLRRTTALPPQNPVNTPKGLIRFDRFTFDTNAQVLIDDQDVTIPLSTAEFRLLMAFVQRPGMILNRDQLLDLTQGREAKSFDRSIDNQVSRLRKKIEQDPKQPLLIKTQWGGGYSFNGEIHD